MKKLLLILAIGAFVACNDSGSDEKTSGDSITPSTADTSVILPADTSVKPIDTTIKPVDTTVAK